MEDLWQLSLVGCHDERGGRCVMDDIKKHVEEIRECVEEIRERYVGRSYGNGQDQDSILTLLAALSVFEDMVKGITEAFNVACENLAVERNRNERIEAAAREYAQADASYNAGTLTGGEYLDAKHKLLSLADGKEEGEER
jgi:hypothetical protein